MSNYLNNIKACVMVWRRSGTGILQGAIESVVVLEQPTYRNLTCWLTREVDAGVGGDEGFALVPRV